MTAPRKQSQRGRVGAVAGLVAVALIIVMVVVLTSHGPSTNPPTSPVEAKEEIVATLAPNSSASALAALSTRFVAFPGVVAMQQNGENSEDVFMGPKATAAQIQTVVDDLRVDPVVLFVSKRAAPPCQKTCLKPGK